MSSAFPAPTAPHRSDSLDSDSDSDPDKNEGHRRARKHRRPRHTYASRIQPPTPSLLTAASTASDDRSAHQGPSDQPPNNVSATPQGHTGTGIDVERWMSESDSEEHEMDSYLAASDDEEAQAGLTAADRRRARHVRRHRVGDGSDESLIRGNPDDDAITPEEKKEADGKVLRDLAINLALIGLWYTFSLSISVYNKWMFSPEHLNFHFPLFTTCLHMVVQFSLSSVVLLIFPQLRPVGVFGAKGVVDEVPPLPIAAESVESSRGGWFRFNSRGKELERRKAGYMTKWVYLTKIFPCGAATGLDIGLGNMSLKFISLAFYTMCKSSSLAFVLIFAFLFRLEKMTWKLVAIISVMTLGVIMMVASEAQFVAIGFILVILASALSGARWSLTQLLLLRNPATGNPFSSIFFLAPCMFVSILAVAIPVEGFGPLFERYGELVNEQGFFVALAIVIFPGVIAFLMVSSEFALLKRSSVVTLSICGIFKEVMTISAAAIIFHDPLTPVNISGLLVTIVSIALYNYLKISKMRQEALEKAHGHHQQSGGADNTTGYAAVVGNDSGDDDSSINQLNESDGNNHPHEDAIRVGESAISPAETYFPHRKSAEPPAPVLL